MDIPPLAPQALVAFAELHSRLLALVRERLSLELSQRIPEYGRGQRELLEDCTTRFGDTLKAVYSFGLFEQLENETAWLVSVLESRGLDRGWVERILESWTIAIQGMVKPPEADELSRPLIWARSLVPRLSGQPLAEDKDRPEDVQRYLDFCLHGQRREAAEFAFTFMEAGLAPEKIAEDLLVPALGQIGRLWENDRIGASTEHLATEITRYVIYRLFDSSPRKQSVPFSAVLACVPGDEHDIGIDLMANLLRNDGWSLSFIGRGSPHQDLLETVAGARPDVVILSVSLVSHLPAAHTLIVDLREKIPGIRIILGGAAALIGKNILGTLVAGIATSLGDGRRIAQALVGHHA
jgi:MerR family transcriptional regulator, light-induced transcriptional regulator